jgi:FkbM family methyltransferase
MTLLHAARKFAQKLGIDVVRFPGDHPLRHVVQLLEAHGVETVLDVGANDGGYAGEIRHLGYHGVIHSFEPVNSVFMRASERARSDPGWYVHPFACGASVGQVTINVAANNAASSSVLPMLPAHALAAPDAVFIGTQLASQCRIDDLWNELTGSSGSAFLKIDVQGYERYVLDGAANAIKLGNVTGIQIELSLVPLYAGGWNFDAALSWMRDHGYSLHRIIPGFTDPNTGRMLQADGVFFRS